MNIKIALFKPDFYKKMEVSNILTSISKGLEPKKVLF